jgi:signal transduction histidine kinase
LFWRVYFHGLLLLLVIAVTAGVLGWMLGPDEIWRDPDHGVPAYLGEQLGPKLDDPAALEVELEQLHRVFLADFAVYRHDHNLVAAAGRVVLEPAVEVPRRLRYAHGRHRMTWLVPLPRTDAYLVVRSPKRGSQVRGLGLIGVVLLILAAVSIPFARRIARPVEKLTQTARQLGAGDLAARSGVRAKGEVGELARALDDMAERIEELLRAEKELLANVSHELRTPLSRIRVALELAEETEDSDALRKRLAGIGTDLAELETLIDDTLVAARLDLARGTDMPLRRERLSWPDLVGQVAARFRDLHPGHHLEVSVAEELPAIVGDRSLLHRVLDNLLDNAAHYSEPAAGPVAVAVVRDDSLVRVEVRDHGVGVAPDDLPRLFEPFYRGDASRDRATGGIGMGLALCRRVVEAHGGSIGAVPRHGGGTTFWFTLPASR